MAMIKPTVGRIVLYTPSRHMDSNETAWAQPGCKLAAIITHVWSDRMVNLTVFDANGVPHGLTSVDLEHGDRPISPYGRHCEWMDYQKGQAAKAEALEAQLKAASAAQRNTCRERREGPVKQRHQPLSNKANMTDTAPAAGAVNPEETNIAANQDDAGAQGLPEGGGQAAADQAAKAFEGDAQAADTGKAGAGDGETQAQQPAEGDGKPRPWTRRDARIEQLLGDNRAMRGFAERALTEKQELEKRALVMPRPEDFRSDADYMQAVANQAVAKARVEYADSQAKLAAERAAAAAQEAWAERTAHFRAHVPDFDAVVHSPDLNITPIMADALRESDLGAEVAYFLGKNPNEAARIASLPPVSQATAIARLETRVGKTSTPATKAPPPAETALKGKSGGAGKSLEDMSFEEYRKARGF